MFPPSNIHYTLPVGPGNPAGSAYELMNLDLFGGGRDPESDAIRGVLNQGVARDPVRQRLADLNAFTNTGAITIGPDSLKIENLPGALLVANEEHAQRY